MPMPIRAAIVFESSSEICGTDWTMLPTTEKAANQNMTVAGESVFLSSLTYMYANAAKNPEPRASSAFGSTVPTSGETIRTIPANAVNTRLATDAETLSASILPERRATNRGPVYWRVTA